MNLCRNVRTEVLQLQDLTRTSLRDYQKELVKRPMLGDNCIVYAPPKSGKTMVAIAVCMNHFLQSLPKMKRNTGKRGEEDVLEVPSVVNRKVVYLVPDRPLILQVYKRLTDELLLWKVDKKSGSTNANTELHSLLKERDIVVCTPQILSNAIANSSVKITYLSLLIFDECHHAREDHAYNMIMNTYLKEKHQGQQHLPQILGLTATPGAGKRVELAFVQKSLLTLCANLDVTDRECFIRVRQKQNITQMQEYMSAPTKEKMLISKRKEDPFSDEIKQLMMKIEQHINITPGDEDDRGKPQYASFISQKLQGSLSDVMVTKSCEQLLCYNMGKYVSITLLITEEESSSLSRVRLTIMTSQLFSALELVHEARMKDGFKYIDSKHRELNRRNSYGKLDSTDKMATSPLSR